ncbi:MAG: T9SS type A sorting domain-containing protein, partial [candidate division WOR-3 bacterium]
LSAATLDPEEPTILYAGVQKSLTLDYKVYLSVDAGRQWIDISEGLPYSSTYSLTIDFNHPDTTYAATDSGLYYYVPPFNKSLVSSSDTATSYNNSRKMVRVENTDEIWITYESGEVIYAVQSLNAGGSWSRKMEIGEGCHPAIALYPCGDPPIWLPCITWRGTDGISLYFSRYDGMNWSAPTLVYQSTSPIGPPGFTVSTLPLIPPMGHIAFNTSETPENRVLYGFFSIFNPGLIDPQTLYIGENMSLVSIDYTSSLNQIHVVFDYDSWIVTRYSTDGGQSWSMPEWVSQVDNNHYPSIEAGGSAVYFFWQGTGPNNQPDIYCRHRYWDGANWWWSEVMRVNYSDGASKYPTSAGGFSCCWSEYTGSNWEIFLSRYDPMTGQWRPPVNISSSTGRSMFSHLNLQQDMTGIIRYFITYTERDQAPYDIAFKTYIPPSEPDQPFYAGDVGQENPGPFNLKRSGYISYGKESYKTIDYDTDFLYYRMGKFNPKKFYKIEGVFYHENEQSCDLVVEIDGKGIGRITVPPKTIKRLKALNPLELYQDSVIYVKAKCPDGNSVLSLLIAYEYEKTKVSVGGGSGTQSVENSLLIPKDFVISNSPNPFRNLTTIRYQLPLNCQVSFEVYDVCGKLIKRLIEGERKAGYYSLVWNGKNEKGKPLASGIYFCKIRAGKFNQTKKLLLLR